MTTAQVANGRFDFGRVVQNTFGVSARNFRELAILALVLSGIPAAILGWIQLRGFGLDATAALPGPGPFGALAAGWILTVVCGAILQATIVRVTVADLNGDAVSALGEARKAVATAIPLIILSLIATIGIMFATLFLVVPGIILAVMWSAAIPALVIERPGIFKSLSRSRNLTRGFRWPIFGLLIIYIVAYAVASTVFGGVVGVAAMAGGATSMMIGTILVSAVIGALAGIVGYAGTAAIYYELRAVKEGVGAAQLAAVFD
ncbi:hypothetical protein [Phenylobacterium sp.]|uniref:hypothetical protein n=1 Tax=Phenylobacterium sp. TaxID=1871053 RepID=UPI00289D5296|nr:hypothetical protein [Phenylobacterium sp.]